MTKKPFDIVTATRENWGYHQGRVEATKGRKAEASDDAYFHGYRLGLTDGPVPNEYTIPADYSALHEE